MRAFWKLIFDLESILPDFVFICFPILVMEHEYLPKIWIGGYDLEYDNLEKGYLKFNLETRFWVTIASPITRPTHPRGIRGGPMPQVFFKD